MTVRRASAFLRTLPALATGFALLLAGCPQAPIPAGNLAIPSAVAAAPDAQEVNDYLVFIADGDGMDLRAFSNRYHLFVRGPNNINAQSIPLSLTMNGQNLPTFRPMQLAGGEIDSNGSRYGFVAVAGPANPPRIAVVNASASRFQSYIQTTLATEDAATCKAGGVSVSCLPQDAIDVVTTAAHVYALLAPDATGIQSFIRMTPKLENGIPVLTLDLAPTALPAGTYGRIAVSSDDTYLYAGNVNAPSVVQVLLPIPTVSVTFTATQTDLAGVGVRQPVVTPTYSGASKSYILAVLNDGRVLTLDPSRPPAMATALDASNNPLTPMSFTVPAQTISFLPCQSALNCQTSVRVNTGGTINSIAGAIVGLADGTATLIEASSDAPQVFSIYNTGAPSVPGVSAQSPWTDNFRDAEATDALNVGNVTVNKTTVTTLTTGYTQDETVTVTFHGEMAGYDGRSGTIQKTATTTLIDSEPTATTFEPTTNCPATTDSPCVGDIVAIKADLTGNCPAAVNQEARITALTTAGQAVLGTLTGGVTCFPNRMVYDVLSARGDMKGVTCPAATSQIPNPTAAGICNAAWTCTDAQITARTCGPWTIGGTIYGYEGRAATNPENADSTTGLFYSPEPQFFYPCDIGTDTPAATSPYSCGPSPFSAQAFTLQLAASQSPTQDPPDDGVFFTFGLSSGVAPFLYTSVASTNGLTTSATTGLSYGVTTLQDTSGTGWIYTTMVGANGLNEYSVQSYTLTGGANFYD